MTKLCDKCHKNPAVVHVRAILLNGKQETSSYCLPCALKLIDGDNPPPGLKEMLDGVKQELSSLKIPGMEEFKNLLEGDSRTGDDGARQAMQNIPEAVTCPHCHNDWGRELVEENIRKCGHCFSVARKQFRDKFGVGFGKRMDISADSQGLPVICEESNKKNRERLIKLLKCYHEALRDNREEGAELLRQEIIGLRQEMTDAIRVSLKSCKNNTACSEYILQGTQGVVGDNTYDGLLRCGWLPFPEEKDAQIHLSSGIVARRTMVDLPMREDATGRDYSMEILSRLSSEPIFKGGSVNMEDGFLASANKRIFAKCGGIGLDGRRAGHFEMISLDRAAPNSRNVGCLDLILRRLESRNTFFTDPEFGYFHPERNSGGSGITLMEYMHLPALCATLGLPRLRKIVGAMDGENCLRGRQGIRLELPYGWSKLGHASYMMALGGFVVLCDTRMFGVSLRERYNNLHRIAASLEKQECAMRRNMRTNLLLRDEILDDMARSYSMLRSCRLLSGVDALPALSNLWLGQELGCYASLSKQRLIAAVKVASASDDVLCGLNAQKRGAMVPIETLPKSESRADYLPEVLWEDQDLDVAKNGDSVGESPVEIFNELPCNVEDFCETLNESFLSKSQVSYAERRRLQTAAKRRAIMIKHHLFFS
ncbi:MAG: hypothetical protein MJ106_01115 [Lentisphaeria bacterium]|nr:hypothetical protein [Lentisphaeria bacterium]